MQKRLKANKEKEPQIKAEVYLEEGSNLAEFEKDVNKGLKRLIETREIIDMKFKTGVLEDHSGKEYSWYSMAMHHIPRESFEMDKIFKRLSTSENSLVKLKWKIKAMEKYIEIFKKEAEKKAKERAQAKALVRAKEKETEEKLLESVKEETGKVKKTKEVKKKMIKIKKKIRAGT